MSLAFSQSGQPRPAAPTQFFTHGGATTAAFVNKPDSAPAKAAQWVFPLHAGVEASVAATKSYIAQLVAGARVVAAWQDDLVLCSRRRRRCLACCRARRTWTGRWRCPRCATWTACL